MCNECVLSAQRRYVSVSSLVGLDRPSCSPFSPARWRAQSAGSRRPPPPGARVRPWPAAPEDGDDDDGVDDDGDVDGTAPRSSSAPSPSSPAPPVLVVPDPLAPCLVGRVRVAPARDVPWKYLELGYLLSIFLLI